mgnify:CR=1 FL=1
MFGATMLRPTMLGAAMTAVALMHAHTVRRHRRTGTLSGQRVFDLDLGGHLDLSGLDGHRIGAYVGLTPSESSSGASRALGGITKTGNGHARRLLIEAAWHHRPAYRPTSPIMRARWDRASAAARARGHAGNQRLHDRWVGFQVRKKRSVVANAAIARELAGWCWSLAVMT